MLAGTALCQDTEQDLEVGESKGKTGSGHTTRETDIKLSTCVNYQTATGTSRWLHEP